MSKVLFWIGFMSFVLAVIFGIEFWYDVKAGCVDYLKLAGDAPNVQKADEFLGKALEYMERNNLTSGNSAFIFHTPSADVGIWYGQIKGV